jgi:hypothetical protein
MLTVLGSYRLNQDPWQGCRFKMSMLFAASPSTLCNLLDRRHCIELF